MKKRLCLILALLFSVLILSKEGTTMKPMQKYILYPTVSVECVGNGSGVVVASDDGISVILTAKHVLTKKQKCRVTVYPDEITYPAEVVKVSEEHDLAMLVIQAEVAHVAITSEAKEYEPTTDVWKCGAGAGQVPFVTKGLLAEHSVDHLLFTAPVVGGDSGGGVYVKKGKRYELIGVVTAHALDRFGAVHHLGYAHNVSSILEFMAE